MSSVLQCQPPATKLWKNEESAGSLCLAGSAFDSCCLPASCWLVLQCRPYTAYVYNIQCVMSMPAISVRYSISSYMLAWTTNGNNYKLLFRDVFSPHKGIAALYTLKPFFHMHTHTQGCHSCQTRWRNNGTHVQLLVSQDGSIRETFTSYTSEMCSPPTKAFVHYIRPTRFNTCLYQMKGPHTISKACTRSA